MVYTKNLKPGMLLVDTCSDTKRVYLIKKGKIICYIGYIKEDIFHHKQTISYEINTSSYSMIRPMSHSEAAVFKLEGGA